MICMRSGGNRKALEPHLYFWCFGVDTSHDCSTKCREIKLAGLCNRSNTGKREVEAGPAFGGVLGPDLAAVRLDEGLGDGES